MCLWLVIDTAILQTSFIIRKDFCYSFYHTNKKDSHKILLGLVFVNLRHSMGAEGVHLLFHPMTTKLLLLAWWNWELIYVMDLETILWKLHFYCRYTLASPVSVSHKALAATCTSHVVYRADFPSKKRVFYKQHG